MVVCFIKDVDIRWTASMYVCLHVLVLVSAFLTVKTTADRQLVCLRYRLLLLLPRFFYGFSPWTFVPVTADDTQRPATKGRQANGQQGRAKKYCTACFCYFFFDRSLSFVVFSCSVVVPLRGRSWSAGFTDYAIASMTTGRDSPMVNDFSPRSLLKSSWSTFASASARFADFLRWALSRKSGVA